MGGNPVRLRLAADLRQAASLPEDLLFLSRAVPSVEP